MSIIGWLKSKLRRGAPVKTTPSTGELDRFILSNVLVISSDLGVDAKKVLSAFRQLKGMLAEDQCRLIALVPEAYPHLERMAAAEVHSADWLEEFNEALAAAADNAERVADEQAEVAKVFDEIRRQDS